jgi:3-oxoacyl-[acyl-carrier protein] reductase
MNSIKNIKKVMLVTGSSRGIGAAIAAKAVNSGFEVVLHGKTESPEIIALSKKLNTKYLIFDVDNPQETYNSIKTLQRLDVLVNNAGVNISAPFEQLTSSDWQQVFATNVFGMVNVINGSLPLIRETTGPKSIINIGSIKGAPNSVGRCAYASSKAAVKVMTAGLAKELAPDITVNCVAPGFVDTDMTEGTMSPRIKKQIESALLGRMAMPEEIASVVLFFASAGASFVTGQTLYVDGGFSIRKD